MLVVVPGATDNPATAARSAICDRLLRSFAKRRQHFVLTAGNLIDVALVSTNVTAA
jgi:hypothetical protein